jgi:hypothetical protein
VEEVEEVLIDYFQWVASEVMEVLQILIFALVEVVEVVELLEHRKIHHLQYIAPLALLVGDMSAEVEAEVGEVVVEEVEPQEQFVEYP